jgi:hypothetical protein
MKDPFGIKGVAAALVTIMLIVLVIIFLDSFCNQTKIISTNQNIENSVCSSINSVKSIILWAFEMLSFLDDIKGYLFWALVLGGIVYSLRKPERG